MLNIFITLSRIVRKKKKLVENLNSKFKNYVHVLLSLKIDCIRFSRLIRHNKTSTIVDGQNKNFTARNS